VTVAVSVGDSVAVGLGPSVFVGVGLAFGSGVAVAGVPTVTDPLTVEATNGFPLASRNPIEASGEFVSTNGDTPFTPGLALIGIVNAVPDPGGIVAPPGAI
jgi:hypothetical protein